jgi:hypothetical protein
VVDVLEALDASAVRRWSRVAVDSFEQHRAEIDGLNVFPIPDRDTGTNLVLTVRAAAEALADNDTEDPAEALQTFARGAVTGAQGNSGVIVAQLLRALADAALACASCDGGMLRQGLRDGAEQARAAVADPVDGTILTVAHAAAEAGSQAAGLAEVATFALAAAQAALERTTEQLPALARAHVVDAGGLGLVVLLDALVRTIGGHNTPSALAADYPPAAEVAFAAPGVDGHPAAADHRDGLEAASPHYEVQYLLDATDTAAAQLRVDLAQMGDSVVIVGTGADVWNVHAHVRDAGAAIEAGIAAGRPSRISVVRFADGAQVAHEIVNVRHLDDAGASTCAVIAVAPGEGLGRLFEREGVHVVAGRRPSTADVVAAVRSSGATDVVLLPNASQITGVAEAAAELVRADGIRVSVVPTKSPVQGLAAVAVHDRSRRFDDDVVAMAEAAAATRFAEVTVAESTSLTSVGVCEAGDVLGLIDGEVVEIGRSVVAVGLALTDRLIGVGAELMTILVGADAQPGVGELLARHVRDRAPFTEVTVYPVGQPRYPLIIGVE